MTRVAFRTDARAGAVSLLEQYRTAAGIDLQVYRARPRTIRPPTAFVDSIREQVIEYTDASRQRIPSVDVVVVHGLFDSGEAVDQGDAFVDGFLDLCADSFHGFGANTAMAAVRTADVPNYIPDWVPEGERRSYYATVITLEGLAAT